ncbi:hypothetical protein [Paracoccus aestuariivivens]|uniref:Uncharacterized protein n=1 Tax=Paracoccus aestuariivivens TaxID=1820333 RepID=A0A6L6JF22_9RHOB|nr:hypothetical protein [Paracoccus aestuariivivens]MTH79339.1 hypothetical protein [Paracoccus aestuariivivens]
MLKDLVKRYGSSTCWKEQVHRLSADAMEYDNEVARLNAELKAAKTEVKAVRLELRVLKAELARRQTLNDLHYAEWMQDQESKPRCD